VPRVPVAGPTQPVPMARATMHSSMNRFGIDPPVASDFRNDTLDRMIWLPLSYSSPEAHPLKQSDAAYWRRRPCERVLRHRGRGKHDCSRRSLLRDENEVRFHRSHGRHAQRCESYQPTHYTASRGALSPVHRHPSAFPFSIHETFPSGSHIEWRSQTNIRSVQSGPPRLVRNSRGRNRKATLPSPLRMG
jgi:hypothetical protein